jgi:TPR repeat protein
MSDFPFPTCLADIQRLTPEEWKAITASEPRSAAQWMLQGANLGNADAQTVLGQWMLYGHGLEPDPAQAFAWFLKAAVQGHPMGMNMVGRCFENGWGCEPDNFVAVNWYRQTAHTGLDAGMYNYANLLATGKGCPQDHATALEWYRKAANLGHAKSMTKIGHYYEDGVVVERDVDAAFFAFGEGARGGDFRGQFNFASMLAARGQIEEALEWLRKVPHTATPRYRKQAGEMLLQSPHPDIQFIGKQMLDSL